MVDANRWTQRTHRQRCQVVARVRREIAAIAPQLVQQCITPQRPGPIDTVSAELLPLCSALRFIGQRGYKILKVRRLGVTGRPAWLTGVTSEVHRQPLGKVLILAAWNYPLLLPGVQVAQALAAGNTVLLKPAPGCEAVSESLVQAFYSAGIPREALTLLPSPPQAAQDAIDQGVDLVVLTGGSQTGRSVMQRCAERLTPSIMELSGCDAVLVGPGADLRRVASAIRFGLSINGGATCIGPRRIIVSPEMHDRLVEALRTSLADTAETVLHESARAATAALLRDAMQRGAVDCLTGQAPDAESSPATIRPRVLEGVSPDWPIANSDLFAPIASILVADSDEAMIAIVNECDYRLAASVFGGSAWASRIAGRLDVGHVSINDLIFPTADPRAPFGGCGTSGFGVTRGAEGLLAMTRPKVIARHRGPLYLHLMPPRPSDFATLMRLLKFLHGRWWKR